MDALSTSAHKFYGPKGVGFLYLRSGTPYLPYLVGGGHENGKRAGTENVPLIVALATALELSEQEREAESARLRTLRDQLIGGILEGVEGRPADRRPRRPTTAWTTMPASSSTA